MNSIRKNIVLIVKALSCITSVIVVISVYKYLKVFPFISELTHPSAFQLITDTLVDIPSAILFLMALTPSKLKDRLFKNSRNADKFIEVVLSIQIIVALSICFFNLRFDYFDLYLSFSLLYDWAYLFFMIFLIAVYMHEKSLIGTKFLYFSGVMQIVFTIASLIFDDFGFGIVTGLALISMVVSYMAYELTFGNIKTGFYYYNYSGKTIENDGLLENYEVLDYNNFEKRG